MKEEMARLVTKIEQDLKEYLDGAIADVEGIERVVWQQVAELSLRKAKRVRAILVNWGYRLMTGVEDERLRGPMMGVELVHAGLLMHDDWIDEDGLRRGKPTAHVLFAQEAGGSEKYGGDMAICAGDLAMMAGVELVAGSGFGAEEVRMAVREVTRGIVKTALGEAADVALQQKGRATESEVLRMLEAKTGIYTFKNPLAVGVRLAGGGEEEVKLVEKWALPVGIAFQIKDDLLGMFGDETKTGKSAASDMEQGKMTLLAAKMRGERFWELYGKKGLTKDEVEEVRELVRESGVDKEVAKQADELALEAKEALEEMKKRGWNGEMIQYLEELVGYVVRREE